MWDRDEELDTRCIFSKYLQSQACGNDIFLTSSEIRKAQKSHATFENFTRNMGLQTKCKKNFVAVTKERRTKDAGQNRRLYQRESERVFISRSFHKSNQCCSKEIKRYILLADFSISLWRQTCIKILTKPGTIPPTEQSLRSPNTKNHQVVSKSAKIAFRSMQDDWHNNGQLKKVPEQRIHNWTIPGKSPETYCYEWKTFIK